MLRAVLFALRYYDDVYGHLPSPFTTDKDGQPACSWRYVTMPYWDPGGISEMPRLDLSWSAPANAPWASLKMDTLCFSPSSYTTSVAAVTGKGTAFDSYHQHKMADLPEDVILVVEVRDFGVHWMEPGDLDIDDLTRSRNSPDATRSIFGTSDDSFIVGFADSDVWVLNTSLPLADLMRFFTIDGAKKLDRELVLGPYRLRSW